MIREQWFNLWQGQGIFYSPPKGPDQLWSSPSHWFHVYLGLFTQE